MEYSEFLQKFYLPDEGGGLVGYKAKKKIPMFFFEHGLDENFNDGIICPSDSTYEKWETGTRKPESSVWAEVIRSFDSGKLQKGLLNALSDKALRIVIDRFDVDLEIDEPPDKVMFAKAIAAQFEAIAHGGGVADNIVPAEYKKPPELKGFETYLREAKRKYKWMRIPGEGEYLLSEFFVCNNIGTSSAVFPHRIRGNYIEGATLPKIRKFDRRGEIKCAILIGACGYGKTLMLQHLFLEATDHIVETGQLPIFAELRNFSSKFDGLVPFLVESVQEFDRNFSQKKLEDLMEKGQAAILLDGLDEMNPEETKFFQRKLAELCHHYPNSQLIISSRWCSAIKGIRGFASLYIHPLDDNQSQQLIDKLLLGVEDVKAKETILSFLEPNKGYVKRNGFVATNPMLLTIMIKNYEKLCDLAGNKAKFYELLYEALIRSHDEEKESFDRFFHSVGSSDEFTQVFREFCAIAYLDGVFEFDHRSFEKYFKQLKCKDSLRNPSIFELTAFQHDVCATACMMYEQESGIYYIDPGFQDYFFAEYYYFEGTDSTKEMGRTLWGRKTDSFRNLDALRMLYNMTGEKVNVCILLPFLDTIFKGKAEDEAFLRFLSYGFGDITYLLLNRPVIDEYLRGPSKAEKFDIAPDANHPKNIVMGLLLDILNLENTFVIGSFDETVKPEGATHFLAGFYDVIRDYDKPEENSHIWLRATKHDIAYIHDREYFQALEFTPFPIIDNAGQAVCFGYSYTVDPLSLLEKPEQQNQFMDLCNKTPVRKIFDEVKQYYSKAVETQKKNDYR